MVTPKIVPERTRYLVPFTQQNYCCVPTNLQTVMYRRNLPLVAAEVIADHLGLMVPPEDAHLFRQVWTSVEPQSSGYGTRISEYSIPKMLLALSIPLSFSQVFADEIANPGDLLERLRQIELKGEDAMLCFNHPVLIGEEYKPNAGHVVIFDYVHEGQVHIVDPSWKHPKWRAVDPAKLFEAMRRHGTGRENDPGIWEFTSNT